MNYIVEFEVGHDAEIYVNLRNTTNKKIVFHEKVTDQVLTVAEKYSKKVK